MSLPVECATPVMNSSESTVFCLASFIVRLMQQGKTKPRCGSAVCFWAQPKVLTLLGRLDTVALVKLDLHLPKPKSESSVLPRCQCGSARAIVVRTLRHCAVVAVVLVVCDIEVLLAVKAAPF